MFRGAPTYSAQIRTSLGSTCLRCGNWWKYQDEKRLCWYGVRFRGDSSSRPKSIRSEIERMQSHIPWQLKHGKPDRATSQKNLPKHCGSKKPSTANASVTLFLLVIFYGLRSHGIHHHFHHHLDPPSNFHYEIGELVLATNRQTPWIL